jgi:glycosyltransferase involved in cell wall biosynthesis
MEICLSSVYHASSYYGGNEHYLHHLALGLQEQSKKFTYLTAFAGTSGNAYKLTVLPVPMLCGKPFLSPSWLSAKPLRTCHLFHASGSGLPVIEAALWLKYNRPHIPRILTFQAASRPSQSIMQGAAALEALSISHAFTHLITTTPYYYERMQRQYPHLHHHFIPLFISPAFERLNLNGHDVFQHLHENHKKIILFAGKLDKHHYYKGLPVLIQALTHLPDSVHLVICGDGNVKADFQKQATTLKLVSRVHFIGAIPHAKMPAYFFNADIFVLPSTSISEGFGMVAIEAMSQKTPVITTTTIGSASWFKAEQVAILVPPNKPDILAKAIRETLDHRDSEKIDKAYGFSRTLNRINMISNTLKVYEKAVS